MPLYQKSEEWQRQTTLLLQARPTTTRITTKYTIEPAPSTAALEKSRAKRAAHLARRAETQQQEQKPDSTTTAAAGPRAYLELKTYCPESGVVLKYRTDKAAEVGRLIGSLARVGRAMAGLAVQEEKDDVVMGEAEEGGDEVEAAVAKKQTGSTAGQQGQTATQQPQQQQQGGGGKKKKKGKK